MSKICPKCGNNNSDDAFWCSNCDIKLTNQIDDNSFDKQERVQPIQKQQVYIPPELHKPKHSFKKLKIAIALIIVIIFLISVPSYFYLNFSSWLIPEEEKFLGTWESDSISGVVWTITFYSNGSYTEEYNYSDYDSQTGKGTWIISNNKLSFSITKYAWDSPTRYDFSWDYSFTESNHLLLTSRYLGLYYYDFIKSEVE